MILAPLEGVSHPTFRAMMAERGGLGLVCTEFVRVSRAPISRRHLTTQVVKADGVPLSVQVMGNDPDKMADAAEIVADCGADVVDINLGCPAPRVVRRGAGSAMLKDPDLLYRVLSEMRQVVPGLLSAKIRAGFDDASHIVRIGRAVEAAGADFITVHPRRRVDFYEGVADWRAIKLLDEALSIPIVGNGDCWYAEDALRMQRETGCRGVMLGRPAMRNPWIFEQVDALRRGASPIRPTGTNVFEYLLDVAARYRQVFPRNKPIGKVKELLTYLGRAIDDGGVFRKTVLRMQSLDDILRHSEAVLPGLPIEQIDLDAHSRLGLEQSGRV